MSEVLIRVTDGGGRGWGWGEGSTHLSVGKVWFGEAHFKLTKFNRG